MTRILAATALVALLLGWWLWPAPGSAPLDPGNVARPDRAMPPRPQRSAPGAATVTLPISSLRNLEHGDRLVFPVPGHDAPLPARVAQRMQHPNGDVSLVATWEAQRGNLVVTLGALESFATLSVDGRTWNLVADVDGAWAAPATALGGPTEDDARVLLREMAPPNPPLR